MNPFKEPPAVDVATPEEPSRPPELWERLPCDNSEQWIAFQRYRDMRPPRKLQNVHFTISGVPHAHIVRWYRENNWEARVEAYDRMLDAINVEEQKKILAEGARAIAAEHMAILASARAVVAIEIERILARTRESNGPNVVLRPAELIKLADLTIRMDRLVRDQTTENVGEGADLSSLSDDELAEYQRLLEKARAKKE